MKKIKNNIQMFSYSKTTWVNGQTPINATNLNHIENGIESVEQEIPSVENTQSNSQTDTYSCDYINEINSYSTNEKVVGKHIDGKPLYEKTFNFSAVGSYTESGVTYKWHPTNISKIEKSLLTGTIYAGNYQYPINNTDLVNTCIDNRETMSRIQVGIRNDIVSQNPVAEVTIRYTKTTD